MGLLRNLFELRQRWKRRDRALTARPVTIGQRICRFETMEDRRMLTASPLVIGAVYTEEDLGTDAQGDTFQITFEGGAPGTQLTRLVIDGDHRLDFGNAPGFSSGDIFFDTVESPDGLGVDHAFPFSNVQIVSRDGQLKSNATVQASVVDGGLQLVLTLTNFVAGDRLVFHIDVDEVQVFDPNETDLQAINDGFDPLTSGAEFQGSLITAHFSAAHYHDASVETRFLNRYDTAVQAAESALAPGTKLQIPSDDSRGNRDRTAGAVGQLTQSPKPVTISGTVYHDRNQDLTQNIAAGEAGIPNVTLALYQADQNGQYVPVVRHGSAVTATTNAQGDYHFGLEWNLLPGTYQIRETQPAAFTISVGAVPGTVQGNLTGSSLDTNTLSGIVIALGDTHAVDYDFAEANPASVAGCVYHDRNHNGVKEAGEAGIAGVRLGLFDSRNQLVREAVTDRDGCYEFTGLRADTYRVVEFQPTGWIDGLDTPGKVVGVVRGQLVANDEIGGISLSSGEQGQGYDFGERLGSLAGRVHLDRDGDCVFDPDELPLAGVTLTLIDAQGNQRSTTTDSQGRYEFVDLFEGTYTIVQTQPAAYFNGGQKAGTGGGDAGTVNRISQINVGGTSVHLQNYDFCEALGSLSGYVYHDRNHNGLREASLGESGIAGVRLRLLDGAGQPILAAGVPRTATTDAQGFYRFDDLAPGTYRVVEEQPVGWIDGKDTPGFVAFGTPAQRVVGTTTTNDTIGEVHLIQAAAEAGALHGVHYNFGERRGQLSGRVHVDTDGDCVYEPGEQTLAGVTIRLVHQDGRQWVTTTNAQGRYEFLDLPEGIFTIVQEQPAGYFNGDQHAGTAGGDPSVANTIRQVVLGGEQIALENYDFCEELGSLSGYVYHDANDNGVREPTAGEQPIAGVSLRLLGANGQPVLDANGQPRTVTTNADGFYRFDQLAPGSYTIVEVQPSGWLDGKDTPGFVRFGTPQQQQVGNAAINDQLGQIALVQSASDRGTLHGEQYNFGELRPASIRGVVHTDINGNCVFEPDLAFPQPQQREVPLAGVAVRLKNAQGQIVATTTTTAAGRYEFLNLRPGTYSVEQVQPAEYFSVGQVAGNLGGDAGTANVIANIQVASGAAGENYDFCEAPPARLTGYVFQDGPPVVQGLQESPVQLHVIRNGARTGDDTPIAGVLLELRHGLDGSPVMSEDALPGLYPPGPLRVRTDANGYYAFHGLPRGNYAVYEVHPTDYVDSIDSPGTTSGLAWNAHQVPPLAALSRLAGNPPPRYDALLNIPLGYGQSSDENNFSEVRISSFPKTEEPPSRNLPPIPAPAHVPLTPPVLAPLGRLPVRADIPIYGAAGDIDVTWHLSIIDAGRPRGEGDNGTYDQRWVRSSIIEGDWLLDGLRAGQWTFFVSTETEEPEWRKLFGLPGAIPVTGDFDGDGRADVGVFLHGEWFIDVNGNGQWDHDDLWARLGSEHDLPVVGDWNGDGKDDIGIFGPIWERDPLAIEHEPGLPDLRNAKPNLAIPKNVPPLPENATSGARVLQLRSEGEPRADLIDHVFRYGSAGDIPVAGDWDGDGIANIGVFRKGAWVLDVNGDGRLNDQDWSFTFGQEGDLPLVGDFHGNGVDVIGVYREGRVIVDTNRNRELDAADRVFELSGQGTPIVGDFDGDGVDDVALYDDLGSQAPQAAERDDGIQRR